MIYPKSFPAITTKKIHWPSVIHELLWILSGDTNINYLKENGVKIWNEWADSDGNLGPVYGEQWRKWKTKMENPIDQVKQVIDMIKQNPDSRRIIVSAWNAGELEEMALMPCHAFFPSSMSIMENCLANYIKGVQMLFLEFHLIFLHTAFLHA